VDEFRFDGADMEDLSRGLVETARRLQVETDVTVAETGGMLRDAAKAIVGEHSKSIPPTVRMRMVPGAAIIEAGSEDVPLAVLYEKGNRGKNADKDTFWHWVFGNKAIPKQPQKRYPFLRPAVTLLRSEIKARMNKAWDRALEPLRMK
jgi:hypothetical protein